VFSSSAEIDTSGTVPRPLSTSGTPGSSYTSLRLMVSTVCVCARNTNTDRVLVCRRRTESGSDSPEGVSGSSGSESGGSCSSNRNSSAGRPGNASGSDESPPSYGGNDSRYATFFILLAIAKPDRASFFVLRSRPVTKEAIRWLGSHAPRDARLSRTDRERHQERWPHVHSKRGNILSLHATTLFTQFSSFSHTYQPQYINGVHIVQVC
jgi:hypothetical protein